MDRSLNSLSSDLFTRACILIARCTERGLAVMIVQTVRTMDEHRQNLSAGTSRAVLSKHLPREQRWRVEYGILADSERNKSDAMDLAPYEQYNLHGPNKLKWDTQDPAWSIIGEEAEKLGLRWGGRWKDPFDPGHVELVLPGGEVQVDTERKRPWPTFRA